MWTIHTVPGKQEENNFDRKAISPPLERMTLSGVTEQTAPQLVLLETRCYFLSQVALWSSSLMWNESHKLVSNMLGKKKSASKRLEPAGLVFSDSSGSLRNAVFLFMLQQFYRCHSIV